jgi:chemotaxis protein MotB
MADPDKRELIIVRRRGTLDSEEGHNSVWKIAYADFMTAMMAFFLVMWLISATNQETRESVASYFNPIKLTDSTPDRKGINEARRVDPGRATEEDSLRPKPEPDKAEQSPKNPPPMPPQATDPRFGEAALFRDPYAVLSEIAGAPPRMVEMGASLDANQKDGLKGGQAYKDPFDPVYWPMTPAAPMEKKGAGQQGHRRLPVRRRCRGAERRQRPAPLRRQARRHRAAGSELRFRQGGRAEAGPAGGDQAARRVL